MNSVVDMHVATSNTAMLRDALHQAALADCVQVAPETFARRAFTEFTEACLSSPALVLCSTAVAALAIVLVIRPPFVLLFEHDSRRPWRGKMQISWFSTLVAVLVTLVAAAAIPFTVEMASHTAWGVL